MARAILTLNAGSSSLKFAAYDCGTAPPTALASGQIEGLGVAPKVHMRMADGPSVAEPALLQGEVLDHSGALAQVLRLLSEHLPGREIAAVGHRVVHGGPKYGKPLVVTDAILEELAALNPLAPLHQPHNLAGVVAARAAFPQAIQVACFDTAFHRHHPWVNDTFALPRAYYDKGVRRYGFHGLSYEYVTERLSRIAPHHAAGRLVVAHLGNGASMCAIRNGRSIGSSMGFSALDGLPMGTRCGQLDPGVLLYMLMHEGLSPERISEILYKESGLKGISGASSDMRALEAAGTPEADQAIGCFTFRVRRELGAMAAILGGIDALAFCGGIGENAWRVREKVCTGFEWLGLELDEQRNRANAPTISADISRVKVFVVATDEEAMIARHTLALMRPQVPLATA